jgi:hypothetical protein
MEHPVCDDCRKELDKVCLENSVWYGYIHVNGTKHLKRIASTDDWEEAWQSDFVHHISRPFVAQGRKNAEELFKEIIAQHDKFQYMFDWLKVRLQRKVLMGKSGKDYTCNHNKEIGHA